MRTALVILSLGVLLLVSHSLLRADFKDTIDSLSSYSAGGDIPPVVVSDVTPVREIHAKLTAYCACSLCCGEYADGKTSIGDSAYRMDGIAVAPLVIPYRSLVYIPSIGWKEADDTGSEMRRAWSERGEVHLDIRMRSHDEALEFGVRYETVFITR